MDFRTPNDQQEDEEVATSVCPSTRASGQTKRESLSFMDMIGLAGRLPDLTEGAHKWIGKLEEGTAGVKMVLGNMESLLMHVIRKQMAEEKNEQLVNKLAQQQLGELTKQKKDKKET